MNKFPIAVRSLQCADHAINKVPTILNINWNLSKRCNYDCSYCSSFIHDAISPWIDLVAAKKFIDSCDSSCANQKKIRWNFTGGEPFSNPGFLDLVQFVRSKTTHDAITVASNGSMPFEQYFEGAKYLHSITFSLHLERSDSEIKTIIDKIIKLKNSTDMYLSVHVMFLPGRSKQVVDIVETLRKYDINIIVRKIDPPLSTDLSATIKTGPGRKDVINKDAAEQQQLGILYKIETTATRLERMSTYYTEEEMQLIKELNVEHKFKNVGIWTTATDYAEVSSDYLIANDYHSFLNWTCFAGVDSFYVHSNGLVYRGMCGNDGPLGHISKTFNLLKSEPTVCQYKYCNCVADIAVRKCSDRSLLPLIS